MDQLIAEHVESVKQDRQDRRRVMRRDCSANRVFGAGEAILPVRIPGHAILVRPEGREYIAITKQKSHLVREAAPHQSIDAIVAVEVDERLEEKLKPLSVAADFGINLRGVGGIEGNPQKDEADIGIILFLARPAEPAEGAVHPHCQACGETISDGPLLIFEGGVMKRYIRGQVTHRLQIPSKDWS